MFDPRKFGRLFALSSMFVGSFFTALSATATNDVVRTEKLEQQASVILASSNTEKLRLQQKENVKLEELELRTLGERDYLNTRVSYYNRHLRGLKLLPSRGQSREIRSEDNNVRRLLKQQLNDAIEIYQIVGQLLDSGELDDDIDAWTPSTLPAIQIAIAETNLATNPEARAVTNEVGLRIAQKWERDNILLLQAGLGFRSDVLTASYYRRYFEIQRIKLGKNNLDLNPIRESQLQQQSSIELNEIELNTQDFEDFHNLPIQTINLLIGYYNANIRLLKLIPREQPLKISTEEDSDLQKLQKQQLYEAIELNRLVGGKLSAGIGTSMAKSGTISNPITNIALPAIQIAIADTNLATNPNERAVAIETGLKIAQTWSKNAVFMEKTALRQRIAVLTAIYWRRHFEIKKLLAESNDLD